MKQIATRDKVDPLHTTTDEGGYEPGHLAESHHYSYLSGLDRMNLLGSSTSTMAKWETGTGITW
jgi:hypothetical protein